MFSQQQASCVCPCGSMRSWSWSLRWGGHGGSSSTEETGNILTQSPARIRRTQPGHTGGSNKYLDAVVVLRRRSGERCGSRRRIRVRLRGGKTPPFVSVILSKNSRMQCLSFDSINNVSCCETLRRSAWQQYIGCYTRRYRPCGHASFKNVKNVKAVGTPRRSSSPPTLRGGESP